MQKIITLLIALFIALMPATASSIDSNAANRKTAMSEQGPISNHEKELFALYKEDINNFYYTLHDLIDYSKDVKDDNPALAHALDQYEKAIQSSNVKRIAKALAHLISTAKKVQHLGIMTTLRQLAQQKKALIAFENKYRERLQKYTLDQIKGEIPIEVEDDKLIKLQDLHPQLIEKILEENE